jgi:hypothetical protein
MSVTSPLVVLRDGERLLIGHIAVGNGIAGLVQRREDVGTQAYTATVLSSGEPVHGGNAAGFICAALDGGGHPLVRLLLERADSVDAALRVLRGLPVPERLPGRLLLADPVRAAAVTESATEEVEPAAPPAAPDEALPIRALAALIAQLRGMEPPPREGAIAAAALAAVLTPDEPPRFHIALGPPSCSVFLRLFPGFELTPELSATPEGAPLAREAAAVAHLTATDPDLRRQARHRLDRAEAETLNEGEEAERMAARMDEHTDDRGAAVRRLVAQSYAAEIAQTALTELAVPAIPQGSHPDPRL